MKELEERRKVLQIEEKGTWGTKYVKIPTFRVKEYIITNDEHKMCRCLEEIYKKTDIRISIQVALNQIIEANTRRYYDKEDPNECVMNKFKGISIDFVLFNIKNNKIICCIELNGKEHETDKKRIERDSFLRETFELLEIPLIQITSKEIYNQDEIKRIIEKECNKG
jgi:hypothetical protein